MNDKTKSVTDVLRLAAKSAAPYATAMIGANHLDEAADTIDTLRAQLAGAQKDAERYRWMRNKETSEGWDIIGRSGTPDQIDDVIDAAMGEPS